VSELHVWVNFAFLCTVPAGHADRRIPVYDLVG